MPIQLRQATWQQPGIDPTGEVISKVGQAVRQGAGDYQDFLDKKARAKALEDQAIADAAKSKRDMFVQNRDYALRKGADDRQGIEADRENNDFMRKQERQAELEDRLNRANQEFAEKYGEQNLPPEEVFRVKDEIAARNKLGGTEEGQRFVGKDQSLGYANLAYKDRQLEAQKLMADERNKTSMYNEGQRAAARKSELNKVRQDGYSHLTPAQLITSINNLELFNDYTPASAIKGASESSESREAGKWKAQMVKRLGELGVKYTAEMSAQPAGFSPYVPQGDASNSPIPNYLLPPQ